MEEFKPSIVILKTGEQIICDLKEVFDGEGEEKKGVCLLMIHPYELSLVAAPEIAESQQDLQIKFSKWCPYSTDVQFKIPYDTVMAIGVPDGNLEQAYKGKVDMITQAINQNVEPKQEQPKKNSKSKKIVPNE
jgi:hypothetical protein